MTDFMIITICGSQTFCKEMGESQKHLMQKGFTVFTPELLVTEEWFQENHSREKFLEMKPLWTKSHFKKIQGSDAVLILNHEKKGTKGYFGPNTLMELSVAFFLDKKIFLLHPIGKEHPYYEELAGINLTVLNGNLDAIK